MPPTNHDPKRLPVLPAYALEDADPQKQWLIDSLWTRTGVGVIGGPPKSAKSWMALDLVLSVASATPALDRFAVREPGAVLLYMAEDAAPMLKARLLALCAHRRLDLQTLPIHVITAASLRLDLEADRKRLAYTVQALKPCLLLLDPFVRLHRLNENDSSAVSALLAYLRALQRRFELAVILVHHMRKNTRGGADGQNLRGSGDFHAWSDDSLYLRRRADQLVLTPEHRSAAPGQRLLLSLVSTDNHTHLRIVADAENLELQQINLEAEILSLLRIRPHSRGELRRRLAIRNQRLGDLLEQLAAAGRIARDQHGWSVPVPPPTVAPERNGDQPVLFPNPD